MKIIDFNQQIIGRMTLLGLICFSVLACGKKEEKEVAKPGVYINNINRTPINLFKEYENCDGVAAESESNYFTLTQFLSGAQQDRNVDMSSAINGQELKGIQISQTYYDAEMMLEKIVRNGQLVGIDFFVTNTPKPMSVCPGIKSYERYSYENASMSATHAISKTVDALKAVDFVADEKVKVYVSPYTIERRIIEFEDRIVKEDLRITDNAYYFPHISSVVFMPQSEESRDGVGFGNIPLWEVPMVGSHEYGHHVFHSIMSEQMYPIMAIGAHDKIHGTKHSCFAPSNIESEIKMPNKLDERDVVNADVIAALNEGFADLIAFYTLDPGESSLEGVVCMEISRDVGSSVFANNEEKLFSANMMETFLSEEYFDTSTCLEPNYQAIHTVGAVFASVFHRLMESMKISREDRLLTVLDWLRDLRDLHPKLRDASAERYLVSAYSSFARTAMDTAQIDPATECDYVDFFFPVSSLKNTEMRKLNCR